MAWYSYFLLNVPETFVLIAVSLTIFGIPLKGLGKQLIIFSFVQGASVFILSSYVANVFKPFLSFASFYLLVYFIFHFTFLKSFIISLTSILLIAVYEIIFVLLLMQVLPITIDDIFLVPWLRILIGFVTVQVPLFITILLLKKYNLKIILPAFIK